ncbi:RCC1 and BTB domain-containing protein [Sarcoptes scabiei]|uniref:RCC1 and BTB domain-containing protein n=1 Tax=Sarcoptes scabiei TaxID=52283 RepID=A0A131ZTX1_SARSC|nr:RCC1 and BTB domain-containing protein [Sarcoptes scabiei]
MQPNLESIFCWPILHQLDQILLKNLTNIFVFGDCGTEVILITNKNYVYGFGRNSWPSLGLGHRDIVEPDRPQEIVSLRKLKLIDIVAGQRHVMALTENGELFSWGENRFGQLGSPNSFESLEPILIGNHIISLACGANHTLALTKSGQVFAWGRNNYGQIGINSNTDQSIPVKIIALEPHFIKMIQCGGSHSMAVTENGTLYAWGGNSFGQLGLGNCLHQITPQLVKMPKFKDSAIKVVVKSIACGEHHSLILMSNGEIYSCGRNNHCQLGSISTPTSEGSCVPIKITSTDRFITIVSHFDTDFSMAISTAGYCYVWGECANEEQPIRQPRKTPLISKQDAFAFYCRKSVTPSLFRIDLEGRSRIRMAGTRIIDRLRQSFNDPKAYDVEFIIDSQSIYVHRGYLQLASNYLNRMLADEWIDRENEKEPITITILSYSYKVFYSYLRYLYTDSLEIDDDDNQCWIEMLDLAHCFLEEDLLQKCLDSMRHSLSIVNCCHYYQAAIRFRMKDFENEIVIFFFNNIFDVCRSIGFKSMASDLCKSLMSAASEIAI